MRNEKELLGLPVPECPDIEQKSTEKTDGRIYHYHRFTAEIMEIKGERLLAFTVYNMGGAADCRFWQNEDQAGMQVFHKSPYNYSHSREPGKMYSACIDSEYATDTYWGERSIFYSKEESCRRVREFTGIEEDDPGRALGIYQKRLREEKIKRRDDARREHIKKRFAGIENPPEAFREWCIESVMQEDRYFFYNYTGKKLQSGKCSHCGKWAKLGGIKEFETGICPNCGSRIKFRSLKKLRKGSIRSSYAVGLLEKTEDGYVMRHFIATLKHMADTLGEPERFLNICEDERIFTDERIRPVESYLRSGGTWSVTVEGFHRESYTMPAQCLIYPGNLRQLRRELGIRAEIETLAERGELFGSIVKIFDVAGLRPELEYLIKGRLYRLAADMLKKYPGEGSELNNGRKAAQVLGIPAGELEKLKNTDPELESFLSIRSLYTEYPSLKQDVMEDICYLRIWQKYIPILLRLAGKCSLRKALNYIKKQGRRYEGNKILIEWRDYMHMAELLGFNSNDRQIYMPKRLKTAHEQIQQTFEANKNELIQQGIKAQSDRLRHLSWQQGGLLIRPARSQQELINEGQSLHHCVGKAGYDRKMAQGRTAIFFIRRAKKETVPLATLELDLKTGKVIQCYKDRDQYPGDRIKAFYTRWEKKIAEIGLEDKTA